MNNSVIRNLSFTLVLIVAAILLAPSASKGIAAPEAVIWTGVSIPAEGIGGKWQLAAGSDVKKLISASDGTLYCYATPTGSNHTLFKSSDNGFSWYPTGLVTDSVAALAAAPDEAGVIYYSTNSTVYRSVNGGANFSALAPNPGGAGSSNITIICVAVTLLNNSRIIAVGTRDRDDGQFGGVYTINESETGGNWSDTALRNCDVLSVSFSPGYTVDRQLIAAGSSENGTIVTFSSGSSGWGTSSGNVTISGVLPQNCDAAFPADYSSTFFLGVDTGNGSGGVFRINRIASPGNSTAVDLNIGAGDNVTGLDVSGLAVSGSSGIYFVLAGAANSTRIYASSDSGQNWTHSSKDPTGQSETIIAMAPDFVSSRRVYAGSSGTGSAVSYSVDAGLTWNQLGMIDTSIDALVDFAVSPKYGQDNTLFLLTWGGEHSLWRTQNSGGNWERIYTAGLGGASSFSHLDISPQYGDSESVVVMAGTAGDGAIWKSSDKGQTFGRQSANFTIDTLAIADNNQYFVSSYNGTNNLVYRTIDGGATYDSPAAAGLQPLSSLKLSPLYSQDRTILAGNSDGWVFLSTDSGASFQEIPGGSGTPPLTGNVYVAFDRAFGSTRIVYAASDNTATSSSRSRIYRYTVGISEQWENLDNTLEAGGILGELCVLPGGSLYAANSHDDGGMERSLNAGASSYQVFERINSGLANRAALWGLWGSGNQLWSMDTRNSRLMTYVDSLIAPVVPGNPILAASGVDTRNVTLDWSGMAGAITYEWQVDNDGSFSSVSSSLKGETASTSVRLPHLEPAATYYWRVRVKEPTLSPWSPVRYFYTMLGTSGSLPALNSPKAAADGVAIRPVFQWTAISGAERYELLVATNVSFVDPVIARAGSLALAVNAWQCDISLGYNTTYYWKIRGVNSNSCSAWSGVGTFTTLLPPVSPIPPLSGSRVVLVSPKSGVQGVGINPVFEWESVPGAGRYELLVSANNSFTEAVIAKVGVYALPGTIWQSDTGLQYGTTYFWKVRGVSGGNSSAWSDEFSFTTAAPPVMPDPPPVIMMELVYPHAGGEGISIRPIFQWKAVSGVDRYELLVSANDSFANPVIKRDGVNALPVEVWQSDIGLGYGTRYFWKVRAISSGNASAWSDISAFVTTGPPVPPVLVIELEYPAAGAAGVSLRPVFQWNPVAGAEKYELLVSASYAFTDTVITKTENSVLSQNVWRSDIGLAADTTYYWKVRAINSANMSVWSKISAFTTVQTPPQTETKLALEVPLSSVVLGSPLSGDGRTGTKPVFTWKAAAGAEKYELLVSPDMAFARPLIIRVGNYALPVTSWESEVELNTDTTYWWKVRAVSGNKSADWSVPGVFITEARPAQALPVEQPVLPPWAIYTGAILIAIIILLGMSVVGLLTRIKRD